MSLHEETLTVVPTYQLVEPLDWSQLRCLLWEALGQFPLETPERWARIAAYVDDHCPHSQPPPAGVYEEVWQKIMTHVPINEEWTNDGSFGHKLWTTLLYAMAQYLFKPNPVFMNLGYLELDAPRRPVELEGADEPYRLAIQLYQHVLRETDVEGRQLLEVGCGCGGGASFIMRYLRPASLVGVDLLAQHVELCGRLHQLPGLSFRVADAEALPFPDGSFDGVVNIESSHSYYSMERFLAEVYRVLRPQGYFWLADLRPRTPEWGADRSIAQLTARLESGGLTLLRKENITANVLGAMDALEEIKRMMIKLNGIEGHNRRHFEEIMLCHGSRNYDRLKSGDWEYWSFVLRK